MDEIKGAKKAIYRRLWNYNYLKDQLNCIGIEPYFQLEKGVVPGVFLFRWENDINYPDLKEYMQRNGVESSVFYGSNAYFIPLHQNLTKLELEYMVNLLKYYYAKHVKREIIL